ncbi:hypothetical protein AAGS40_23980 [Paraburkholderia sp. PREW-6R]|uniref:hypothetical protein n=1 Tax=Paraburkholderia sp. PREW-6R TaxID=3141544 RepID=UPI0031F5C9D6
MWVRAVAAAVAVWCASSAVTAAEYSEVWNPPEAAGHVGKHSKQTTGGAIGQSGAGHHAASRTAAHAGSKSGSRAVAQHVAGTRHPSHSARNVAAASNGKTAHGQVKTVAGKAAAANPNATKAKPKAALVVQSKKPHAQFAQSRASQGKVVHANFVQGRSARAQTVKVAAKSTVGKPAAPHGTTTAASANVGAMSSGAVAAHPATSSTDPATASSGSLPPILH